MSESEKLARMLAEVPTEAKPYVQKLLGLVVHDLRGPLSTFSMDLFSSTATLKQLANLLRTSPNAKVNEAMTELNAMLSNIQQASDRLADYVEQMDVAHSEMADPPTE